MISAIREWLTVKWARQPDDGKELIEAYGATFGTLHGQKVLRHLLESVYLHVYEGTDPIAMAIHCGRRQCIHEILENIDLAENPKKYELKETTYAR